MVGSWTRDQIETGAIVRDNLFGIRSNEFHIVFWDEPQLLILEVPNKPAFTLTVVNIEFITLAEAQLTWVLCLKIIEGPDWARAFFSLSLEAPLALPFRFSLIIWERLSPMAQVPTRKSIVPNFDFT